MPFNLIEIISRHETVNYMHLNVEHSSFFHLVSQSYSLYLITFNLHLFSVTLGQGHRLHETIGDKNTAVLIHSTKKDTMMQNGQ